MIRGFSKSLYFHSSMGLVSPKNVDWLTSEFHVFSSFWSWGFDSGLCLPIAGSGYPVPTYLPTYQKRTYLKFSVGHGKGVPAGTYLLILLIQLSDQLIVSRRKLPFVGVEKLRRVIP